jgi:hypothetical protein
MGRRILPPHFLFGCTRKTPLIMRPAGWGWVVVGTIAKKRSNVLRWWIPCLQFLGERYVWIIAWAEKEKY